jgi:hypothetical protein
MQLKKIALAIAAAASMVSSFAAVNTTDAPELVFMAWNAKGTYAKDLGTVLSDIRGVKTFEFAGTKWNDFLRFGGTETKWAVASVALLGEGFDLGDMNLYSSFTSTAFSLSNQRQNGGSQSLVAKFGEMNIAGGGAANHEIASAVGVFGDVSEGYVTYDNAILSASDLDTTSTMARIYTSNDDGGAASLIDVYATTANFAGTTLTITAVPEPTTYAMLIAGLLGIGFMVRRRNV